MDELVMARATCDKSPNSEHDLVNDELTTYCRWCSMVPRQLKRRVSETTVTSEGSNVLQPVCKHSVTGEHRLVRGSRTVYCANCFQIAPPGVGEDLPRTTKAERREAALQQRIGNPVNGPKGPGRLAKIRVLIERDGLQCFYCEHELLDPDESNFDQAQWWPTLDHLLPRSAGGTNDLENLVLACKRCNVQKGLHMMMIIQLVKRLRGEREQLLDQLERDRAYTDHLKWELFDAGLGEMPGITSIARGDQRRPKKHAHWYRARPAMHNDALFAELGQRVVANLRSENSGGGHARTASIVKRGRKLERTNADC